MHDASRLQRIAGTSPACDEAALVAAAQATPTAFGAAYRSFSVAIQTAPASGPVAQPDAIVEQPLTLAIAASR